MSQESRFVITKTDDGGRKYLRHEGHAHLWTRQKSEAMEYTKFEVADALAKKVGGIVTAI